MKAELVISLDRIGMRQTHTIGHECASLSDMTCNLSFPGDVVPQGFVITKEFYRSFLLANNLQSVISRELSYMDNDNLFSHQAGVRIRNAVRNARVPYSPGGEVIEAYELMSQHQLQQYSPVALATFVRENPSNRFITIEEPEWKKVHGPAALIDAVRECYAQMFNNQFIRYSIEQRINILDIHVCICVRRHSDN